MVWLTGHRMGSTIYDAHRPQPRQNNGRKILGNQVTRITMIIAIEDRRRTKGVKHRNFVSHTT